MENGQSSIDNSKSQILAGQAPLQLSRILYKSALFSQNRPNLPEAKMSANSYYSKNYENLPLWASKSNQACPEHRRMDPISRKKSADTSRNPALSLSLRGVVEGSNLSQMPANPPKALASNTPAELYDGLYKPGNDRYYSRLDCRCSSMVEHSFRKAEVEGSTPSIGLSVC